MERRWAAIDLGVLAENPGLCRLYTDLWEQWAFCAGVRSGISKAVEADPREAIGRAPAKRRKG